MEVHDHKIGPYEHAAIQKLKKSEKQVKKMDKLNLLLHKRIHQAEETIESYRKELERAQIVRDGEAKLSVTRSLILSWKIDSEDTDFGKGMAHMRTLCLNAIDKQATARCVKAKVVDGCEHNITIGQAHAFRGLEYGSEVTVIVPTKE